MVKKGIAQLVTGSEVEEIVSLAIRELKQSLVQIEDLNESLINGARNMSETAFSGEFGDAFIREVEKERRLTQNLNIHSSDVIRRFSNRYDQFLTETSSQSYVYETELIPTGNSGT